MGRPAPTGVGDDGPTVVGSASVGAGPDVMAEAFPVDDIDVPPLTDEVVASGHGSAGGPDLGSGADEDFGGGAGLRVDWLTPARKPR